MADNNTILSTENLPTVVVVTFAAVVLSLAFNFYNLSGTTASVNGLGEGVLGGFEDYNEQLAALEARVSAVEAAAATAAAPSAAAEEPAEVAE